MATTTFAMGASVRSPTTYQISIPSLFLSVVFACASLVIGAIGYYLGVTTAPCDSLLSSHQWWSKQGSGHSHGRQWSRALDFLSKGGGGVGKCKSRPPYDVNSLKASLQAATFPASYEKVTTCEDLGRACIMGGGDVLLFDKQYQATKGKYSHIDTNVSTALHKMHYHVSWDAPDADLLASSGINASAVVAGNADQFLDTMKRYERNTGLRLWPGGMAAKPPVRFASHCDATTPIVLFWDFPENYFHGIATLTALWNASLSGSVDLSRMSVAVGLPHMPARGLPRWLQQPLQAMLKAASTSDASALPRFVTTLSNFASIAGSAASGGGLPSDGSDDVIVSSPPAVCYDSLPVCAVSSFLSKPVPGMYAYMQHVSAQMLLGRRGEKEANGLSRALRDSYATGPTGVLRITIASRPEGGSRRILNLDGLLSDCATVASIKLSDGQRVPVRCESYAFGSGPRGMIDDAAKMADTDVLVGVHGAGLTNLGFLRPGATVIELRPSRFRPENGDRFYRPMARESGVLKWWGIVLFRSYEPKGRLEQVGLGNPDQYGRDRDVILPWRGLAEALGLVLPLSQSEWAARERRGAVFTEIAPGERGY